MPKLSVWFIRASLIYMSIGFLFGALVLLQKGILTLPWAWRLLLPHTEIMIFGWTLQFVIGVAFWILPRFSQEPRYGRVTLAWGGFALFNAGLLLVIVGSWLEKSVVRTQARRRDEYWVIQHACPRHRSRRMGSYPAGGL